jgi:hypothetical protein
MIIIQLLTITKVCRFLPDAPDVASGMPLPANLNGRPRAHIHIEVVVGCQEKIIQPSLAGGKWRFTLSSGAGMPQFFITGRLISGLTCGIMSF